MASNNRLFRLQGKIQHYQWGGHDFIPNLLRIPNPEHKPFAEYWLGAHDNAPAEIPDATIPLNEYIKQHPDVLGDKCKKLSYLLKVLDVKDMLSIQVHPSKEAAVIEFDRENKEGVPLDAPYRNYKDDNHKPELMVALSDFWLLHGFKTPDEIEATINSVPEFNFMLPLFREGGYKNLYSFLMQMEQQEVNRILQPLLERIVAAYDCDYLSKNDPHFWAARAALTFNDPDKIDRGIFSIYLLNLVHLNEGEAIFQDAGILHAYLEGQNIEIMANSDNVLRGGLTPKHIDVNELMKHVHFEAVTPSIIHAIPSDNGGQVFHSPAPDFRLSRFLLDKNQSVLISASTTEIFLVMEGEVVCVESPEEDSSIAVKKGEAAVAFAGATFQAKASEASIFYRATVNL